MFDEAENLHKRLLFDNIELNEGMIMENMVAQMLTSTGRTLHFFSSSDRADSSRNMGIDFLIANTKIGSNKNIVPIEDKSGKIHNNIA